MAHDHTHGDDVGGRPLLIALVLNISIVGAQIVGGLISGSLALLADAVHNLSDAAALGVSYGARKIARRDPDQRRTFGYARVETVAALINLTALIVVGLYLLVQAIIRLLSPEEVQGTTMLIVGAIAFVEDMLSVLVLYKGAKGSLNIRSAMLHLVADTLTTVAVMFGAVAVMLFDVPWIDPVLTILISVFILVQAVKQIRSAGSVLIESAPEGFDMKGAVQAVETIPGIEEVHHVHVWRLDENRVAAEAHIVMERSDLDEIERVKDAAKKMLHDEFGVEHTTLEIELDACAGQDRSVIPKHEGDEGRRAATSGNE